MTARLAAANNLSIEQAGKYLARIGDTPELDDDGDFIVRDEEGVELARLTLPESDASSPV